MSTGNKRNSCGVNLVQEASDAATLVAKGCMGPIERQRVLRWDERLRITQSSLSTQARRLRLPNDSLPSASPELNSVCRLLCKVHMCKFLTIYILRSVPPPKSPSMYMIRWLL